jgi:hypothetical protein
MLVICSVLLFKKNQVYAGELMMVEDNFIIEQVDLEKALVNSVPTHEVIMANGGVRRFYRITVIINVDKHG